MRFHVVGLPHTETTGAFVGCAFTTNIAKFCGMMRSLGHTVYLYAGEVNEADCDEHIPVVSAEERVAWYGPDDPNTMPTRATWEPGDLSWQTMNVRAADAIRERAQPGDLLCLVNGWAQQPIALALPWLTACEFNGGYDHYTLPSVCFPSSSHRHYLYGKYGQPDGRFDDEVIPHAFHADDFHLADVKGDYLLYLGRMIRRKGIQLAAEIADRAGLRLLMAGQGVISSEPGRIVTAECEILGDHIEYLGPADAALRAELMAGAHAVLMPTLYLEMFGCVAVEAMLSGTPPITTDFGAFPETVQHGVTGYRFKTIEQAVDYVAIAGELDPRTIRTEALARYSTDVIRHRYDYWLRRLENRPVAAAR